jgi:hypothetical protein
MKTIVRWYDRQNWPYASDRERLEQYANWLKQIPWTFFCTFTFAWKVSDRQAEGIFREFIKRLELALRCHVAYVRGDEKRLSGCGKSACARHFHALLACTPQIRPRYIEEQWMSMAGNRNDGAGAVVKTYEPERNGVEYVLKFINQTEGDWDCGKLELFMHPESASTGNHATRRRLRRHQARQQQFAPIKLDEKTNGEQQ